MAQTSEAAEQMVSFGMKGIEVIMRLTGAGAKNLTLLLIALLKDNKKFKGKTTLQRLLREGKELKIFEVDGTRLKEFALEAKRYGVLYTAVRDNKNPQNVCDVIVRAEDASKINRIIERLQLATKDVARVKTEIVKERDKENPTRQRSEKSSKENGTNLFGPLSRSNETFDRYRERTSIRAQIMDIKDHRATQSIASPAISAKTPTKAAQVKAPSKKVR